MKVYCYYGPMPRRVSLAMQVRLALLRIPGVEAYSYECSGTPELQGARDLNIDVDWNADESDHGDWRPPKPLTLWMGNATHRSDAAWSYRLRRAGWATTVFHTHHQDGDRLRREGVESRWLPPCAEPWIWMPRTGTSAPDRDVAFLGSLNRPGRVEWLDRVIKAFPSFLVDEGIYLDAAAEYLARGRVILNHSTHGGINARVFEAMLVGGILVTPATDDMDHLGFMNGVHCWTYRNIPESLNVIRAALDMKEPERTAMRDAARQAVFSAHTVVHRAYALLGREPSEEEVQRVVQTDPASIVREDWKNRYMLVPVGIKA